MTQQFNRFAIILTLIRFLSLRSLSPPGGNGSSSGNLSSNTSSLNTNVCNTNQRRRKGSISSVETSEESMDSDNGDSNSVSRDMSPTHERTYAVNKVQNDQIPTIEDVEDSNTIIIIDDSADEHEPVRAPLVSDCFFFNSMHLFYSHCFCRARVRVQFSDGSAASKASNTTIVYRAAALRPIRSCFANEQSPIKCRQLP